MRPWAMSIFYTKWRRSTSDGRPASRRMTVTVRRARPADLAAICAIESQSFDADRFPPRNLRRLLGVKTAAFLIAERSGTPLGYALLLFRKGAGAARLYSLASTPAARGSGVGTALLERAAACAKKRGADRLRLEVRASNRPAVALYSRQGFSILKESPRYYEDGESALKMERRLRAAEG